MSQISKRPPRPATPVPALAPTASDPLLTAAQVADRLQISLRTLDRLVKDGELPSFRIGKKGNRRFKSTDLERLLIRELISDEKANDLDSFITNNIKQG